jgi:thiamine kinase-like enzyme
MDLWSDNLLFRVKEEDREAGIPPEELDLDCFIIDWQMVGVGNPSHDLAHLTMLSMESSVRKNSAPELLEYYYSLFQVGWL